MNQHKHIFLTSFLLTLTVFTVGILLSYGLDFLRVDQVLFVMQSQELDTEAYLLEKSFIEEFGGDVCASLNDRIYELKSELSNVGADLTNYGGKTLFKKTDFDYLKRKYFLLEIKLYTLINDLNTRCGQTYIPILFFYEIDDVESERQGYILEDVSISHPQTVAVLSFDLEYEDEPLLLRLIERYNVTHAPTLIINNNKTINSLIYTGPLNQTIIGLTTSS